MATARRPTWFGKLAWLAMAVSPLLLLHATGWDGAAFVSCFVGPLVATWIALDPASRRRANRAARVAAVGFTIAVTVAVCALELEQIHFHPARLSSYMALDIWIFAVSVAIGAVLSAGLAFLAAADFSFRGTHPYLGTLLIYGGSWFVLMDQYLRDLTCGTGVFEASSMFLLTMLAVASIVGRHLAVEARRHPVLSASPG